VLVRMRRRSVGIAVLAASALLIAATASPAFADKSYTLANVKSHSTAKNCWTVVGSGVFNVTKWINKHPGGSPIILTMCGIDATAAFKAKHGLIGPEANRLAAFRVGTVAKAAPQATLTVAPNPSASPSVSPKPLVSALPVAPTISSAQVASHNTANACWTVVNNNVYNVTSWIGRHPGGRAAITAMCGTNATAAFTSRHGSAAAPLATLQSLRIGALDKTSASPLPTAQISGKARDGDNEQDD
jgi:cytochrome b involved in lipid metabolism